VNKVVKIYWFSELSVKINSIKPLISEIKTIISNGGNNENF